MAVGRRPIPHGQRSIGGKMDDQDFRNLFKNIVADKNLGQNFLFNPELLKQIADSAELKAGDHVLEIGPGLGTLTREMLARNVDVTAVEFDENLARDLEKNISKIDAFYHESTSHRLTVVHDNILHFDFAQMKWPWKIVANIPYNLTKPIITKILESNNAPELAALLVQDEVAQKLVVKPGDLSILAIRTQIFADVKTGIFVGRHEFTPAPKVDSRVVILRPRNENMLAEFSRKNALNADDLAKRFWRLVNAGFANKRKKIRTSLAPAFSKNKDETAEFLSANDINSSLRAQDLSILDWLTVAVTII